MKAVLVKYHGPTDTQGSRWSASASGWGRVYVPFDYGAKDDGRMSAVKKLIDERATYCDTYPSVCGGLPNGDYAYCFALSASEDL